MPVQRLHQGRREGQRAGNHRIDPRLAGRDAISGQVQDPIEPLSGQRCAQRRAIDPGRRDAGDIPARPAVRACQCDDRVARRLEARGKRAADKTAAARDEDAPRTHPPSAET